MKWRVKNFVCIGYYCRFTTIMRNFSMKQRVKNFFCIAATVADFAQPLCVQFVKNEYIISEKFPHRGEQGAEVRESRGRRRRLRWRGSATRGLGGGRGGAWEPEEGQRVHDDGVALVPHAHLPQPHHRTARCRGGPSRRPIFVLVVCLPQLE